MEMYFCEKTDTKSTKSTQQTRKSQILFKFDEANSKIKSKSKFHKYNSNKNNNLKNIDNISLNKNSVCSSSSNNITINDNYRKDLYETYAIFLSKKKFQLSNIYNEKNSKKFLEKKDKCLERIILPDLIEDNNLNIRCSTSKKKRIKRKFASQENISKYIIVISNYDEEKKSKNENNYSHLYPTQIFNNI